MIYLPPSAFVSPGAHSPASGSCSLPKLCPESSFHRLVKCDVIMVINNSNNFLVKH